MLYYGNYLQSNSSISNLCEQYGNDFQDHVCRVFAGSNLSVECYENASRGNYIAGNITRLVTFLRSTNQIHQRTDIDCGNEIGVISKNVPEAKIDFIAYPAPPWGVTYMPTLQNQV